MRLILLAALLTLMPTPEPPPQGAAAAIEGKVLRLGTSEPLASVTVTLVRPSTNPNLPQTPEVQAAIDSLATIAADSALISAGLLDSLIASRETALGLAPGTLALPQTSSAVTDATGSFSFKNLSPGRYTVRAQREGYFGAPVNGNAPTVVTTTVTIETGKPVPSSDVLMIQGGIVSGRVRDPNGLPVSGIQVTPNRLNYFNGRETLSQAATAKPTDDRGEYRLFWLPPGQYYIGVTPRAPGAVAGPQDSWARTFYPGVTDPLAGTLVTVKDGGEATGIDINIRPGDSRVFKISGVAQNPLPFLRPNPANVVERSVSTFVLAPREPGILDGATPPQAQNALPVAQRPNGEFEIRNVRPGNYDLYTLYLDTPLRRYFTSRTPVEVRNADVAGLTLTVNPGVAFSGEVVVNGSGGKPVSLTSLRVGLRAVDTLPGPFATIIGAIQLDASGKFTTGNIPEAKYTAAVTGLPDTAFVEDIRQGGSSVYDNGFILSTQQQNPIQIIVNPGGVVVEGNVSNGDRKPVARALVVLVPPEAHRQNTALFKTATSDDSGHFTLRAVPPGPYTLFAWEDIPPGAWQNAKILSKYEAKGKALNVAASSQVQTQLEVIPKEPVK